MKGLWQTEPRDCVLEKAFNELVSKEGSVCCVCSMFESSTVYTHWSRECLETRAAQLRSAIVTKPLRVVVQRALVHISSTVSNSSSTTTDKLLVCHHCSIATHKCECVCTKLAANTSCTQCGYGT